MRQHRNTQTERRRDVRRPKAFAFWIHAEQSERRVSAWMLDVATGGASFLTAADKAPAVGVRIALAEMHTHDRLVREGAGPLPAFARVVRHDDTGGLTRRVAVRFESDRQTQLMARVRRAATTVCPRMPATPMLPPPQVCDGIAVR